MVVRRKNNRTKNGEKHAHCNGDENWQGEDDEKAEEEDSGFRKFSLEMTEPRDTVKAAKQ